MRNNNRQADALRPVTITWGIQPHAYSSLLISFGNTQVICAISLENSVPPFLRDSGQGWITAEYGMLPAATNSRYKREAAKGRSGRTYEIQRLIGRSLRMMIDLKQLGERTLRIDCDVLSADGGTRTASITGAALALNRAVSRLVEDGLLAQKPELLPLAAISVGLVDGEPRLDLDYDEDSGAEVDANFVMDNKGRLIEVQSTAEGRPFARTEFDKLIDLAQKGINELLQHWEQ
ncbi:MAG: ribonuclease PH [Desulfobulbaceae bacterium]|nr:ribonuclease PH [Desulfobulbaceae bacterium]